MVFFWKWNNDESLLIKTGSLQYSLHFDSVMNNIIKMYINLNQLTFIISFEYREYWSNHKSHHKVGSCLVLHHLWCMQYLLFLLHFEILGVLHFVFLWGIDICILCFHINYLYHCAIITYIPYFITYILWPKQLVHARHWPSSSKFCVCVRVVNRHKFYKDKSNKERIWTLQFVHYNQIWYTNKNH